MDFVCESRHFIVEYHESERTCVEEVLNLLEERYSDITEKTGSCSTNVLLTKVIVSFLSLNHLKYGEVRQS